MGGSKFFSSLDLRSGYWQVAIDPESADKTASVTIKGTLWFKVLGFGLTNAPALFQRLMDLVLAGLTREVCFAPAVRVKFDQGGSQQSRLADVRLGPLQPSYRSLLHLHHRRSSSPIGTSHTSLIKLTR